jgi:hypothetical protein
MKRLWIALLALLLSGCAIVPIAPYGYAPASRPRATYGYPDYPHHYYGHSYSPWQGR